MASERVHLTPQAERDIDFTVVYIAEHGDPDTAIRFFDAAHSTFRYILTMPGDGKVRRLRNRRIPQVHQWVVAGFEKYLIFYLRQPTGVLIVRVLHGARDVDAILDSDTHLS